MISIHRCAACGSPSVVYDTKNEGFSVGKAVAGTIVFGYIGAVAGINGKKRGYYNCGACGTSLTYCMPDTIKGIIDRAVARPDEHINHLIDLKNKYPNIEWENSGNIVNNSTQLNISDFAPETLPDLIYNYCVNNNRFYGNKDELAKAALEASFDKYEYYHFNEAFDVLAERGLATKNFSNGDIYYTIHTEAESIKNNITEYYVEAEVDIIFLACKAYLSGILSNILKDGKMVKLKAKELLAAQIYDDEITDNPLVINKLVDRFFNVTEFELWDWDEDEEDDEEDFDENQIYIVLNEKCDIVSADEVKQKISQEHNKYNENQKYKNRDYVNGLIMKFLKGDNVICLSELDDEHELNKIPKAHNYLNDLVTKEIVEKTIRSKKTYYVLKGGFDRIEEKEKREAIAANNRVINDKISALEAEKAQKQAIYEEFKSKIFGEGARKKKEAQQRIIQIDTEIANLKRQLR